MKRSFVCFFLIIFCYLSTTFAQAQKTLLILPFELYTQQNLSYLSSALPQMIASRIFSPGKVEVIDPDKVIEEAKKHPKITRETAVNIGKALKADYVIFGSITQLGDMVSIDAQILDLSGEKKPAQFFQEIKGLSEVIPQITRFARKSRLYIEGKEEDFYREDLVFAPSGAPYASGRFHPERGFYGYPLYPYPMIPKDEGPKVTRAKPRFGDDDLYEGLTKDLVIDLSGSRPVIGFAKTEEENSTAKKSQNNLPPYYYPPQPYYYSPPPVYYQVPREESFTDKLKRWVWPFGQEKRDPQLQPIPQPTPQYVPQPYPPQTPQQPLPPPSQKTLTPKPQESSPKPQEIQRKDNPWSWN